MITLPGKFPVKFSLSLLLFIFINSFLYAQVVDSLKQALATSKEDTGKVNILSKLVWELHKMDMYDTSLSYIEEGIKLGEKLKHTRELAHLYRRSGDYYAFFNNYSKALQDYTNALDIETLDGRKPKMAVCHDKLARVFIEKRQFPKAVYNLMKELSLYEHLKDTIKMSDVLLALWDVQYKKMNDVKSAAEYLNRVQVLVDNTSNDSLLAYMYNKMGVFYSREGDYEKAAEYLTKSLSLHEKQNNQSEMASDYFDIGSLYEKAGNYRKLLEYSLKIVKIREQLGNKSQIALAYNNVGWSYQLVGDYSKALECQLKSYQFYMESGGGPSLAYPMGNLGIIYNHLGDYNKAIDYSTKAMALFQKSKDFGGVAEAYNNIGNAYVNKGEFDKAINYLKNGLENATNENVMMEIKNAYSGLSSSYEKKRDYQNAYHYYQLFVQIRDSIMNQENSDRISGMHFSIENEKSQKAIELLSRDSLLKETELKSQRSFTYTAVAGALLTLSLMFFAFRGYRQKQKVNEKLAKFNTKMEEEVHLRTAELVIQKEAIEKSYSNTKLLSNIGREIAASLSVEEIIEKVYENVNALMDASVFLIGIYNAEKNQISVPGAIEKKIKSPFYFYDLKDKTRPAVWCFENQKEIFINDFRKEYNVYFPDNEIPAPVAGESPESLIYFPLSTPNKKIGVISVQSFKKNAYAEYHLDIIRNLAIYVTTALENARLYGNMEAEVKERTAEIEKQRDQLARLSIVASETDNAIVIADEQGTIEWVNASYTRLTGYSLEDLKRNIGTSIMAISGNPEIQQIIEKCIANSKSVVYDVMNKTKDGKEIWVQTTLTTVLGADGRVKNLVAIDSDITELKRVETEIKKQNEIISEKNKHITDSINYAKHIQDAILPTEELMKNFLSNSFILFKPKDIVSGDFYWMTEKGDKLFFAVVDCTGHGVPGAFVSIIGNNGLYRAVNEFGLTKPSEILDKLNELLEETFRQDNKMQIKDGMDLAFCCYDKKEKTLEFAGANNPLYHISNGILTETKGDKQPIGAFDNRKKFTNHFIPLKENDSVYVFSDGYADQFGGPSKKKLKYNEFKKMLLSIQDKLMDEQRDFLNNSILSWMGDLEQVDDICVIGVRIG